MLELLANYARDHDLVAEPGFKPKTVRWAILCDGEGGFLDVLELGDTGLARNPGRPFPKCADLSQPEIKRAGQGCRHFLVDQLDVATLFGKDTAEDRAKRLAKHEYFVRLLRAASNVMPALRVVADLLEDPGKRAVINESLAARKAKSTDKVTFAVQDHDPLYLVDSSAWHDWWRAFRRGLAQKQGEQESGGTQMRCLASGEIVAPVLTQPKIEGLSDVGGLPTGDALASFKQESFTSYGLSQSANAAVSEELAAQYRAALNHLIKEHGQRLAGAKVVHWFKKRVPREDDPCPWLTSDQETTERSAQGRARELLEAIRSGGRPELLDNHYYVLTLSGASGRVMVRDWMEGQFETLVANVLAWFEDLSVVRRDGTGLAPSPRFIAVLAGLVRDLDELAPPLVAKMWRAAVGREAIPRQAMAQALGRTRSDILKDEALKHTRLGLIKAYHVRKGDVAMKPYLNEEHPDPAYHCGRLMAVLAGLQQAALGDVGAGVVQRYYAAASSTPALVLGRLTRTSQFHLSKLDKGLARWFDGKIGDVWSRLRDRVPATLSLEEQSLFALGYYHQLAVGRREPEGKAAVNPQ